MSEADEAPRLVQIARLHTDLYGADSRPTGQSLLTGLLKKSVSADGTDRKESAQAVTLGRQEIPFDMDAVRLLMLANEHHSTCIHTKVAATLGLGHETEEARKAREARRQMQADGMAPAPETSIPDWKPSEVDDALDMLCDFSWRDTFNAVGEDYYQTGNGYLEVIREKPEDGSKIVGLSHIPARFVRVFVEDLRYNFHYEIESDEGMTGKPRRFARFGDLSGFINRATATDRQSTQAAFGITDGEKEFVSEVIHFRQPNSHSRWYGFPRWLAAVPSIELSQMLNQFNFDFFLNRGVPELMVFFNGAQVGDAEWKVVTDAMKAGIGLTKSHKSIVLNLPGFVPGQTEIQVERLAMEEKNDGDSFGSMKESLAMAIVSAHQVPPLLAGIQIPGKLGATNELPNAIMAFQTLVIGPQQQLIQQILSKTLGNKKRNGGLSLRPKHFLLRRITEEIDLSHMDTVARMRQSPAQAKAEGRDLSSGTKD